MTAQEPTLKELLAQVSPDRLKATVEKLASYPTRNTNSPMMAEAAEWLASEYRKIPGLQVELFRYQVARGRRIVEDKEVVQVVAVLPGATDRRLLVGGHMDSINLQADPLTGRAPGANDDASGTALALELARVMSARKWNQTLVFVGFSGEEQGLLGSRALARHARAENWKLEAVLSNDIVGGSENDLGQRDKAHVRVFSEEWEPPAQATAASQPTRPRHNARELARFVEWIVRRDVEGFRVKLVMRRDRFGRGGDHTSFTEEGFDAIRFSEVFEEYGRQHNDRDLPEFVDYDYLANVTRSNLAVLASLANAGPAPANVRMAREQGHHTRLTWTTEPGVSYVVYWRDTASPVWQYSQEIGATDRAVVERVNVDDHIFAVGAVGGVPVLAR